MKCGVHKCPRACHYRSDHSQMACVKIVEAKCVNGHVQKRKCSETSPLKCKKCEIETQRDNKNLERDVALQDKRLREQVKYEIAIADIDMQMRKIREEAEDKKTSQERAQALEQKKRDLEAAKHDATRKSSTTTTAVSNLKPLAPLKSEASNRKTSGVSKPSFRIESASTIEWERQKRVEGDKNAALDDLMALSGLEEVKEKFLDIKAKIETTARQDIDVKKERMGMVMLGNPGTGMMTRI